MPAVRRSAVPLLLAGAAAMGACSGAPTVTVTQRVTVRADGSPFRPATAPTPAGHPWSKGAGRTIMEGLVAALGHAPHVRYVGFYDGYVVAFVLDDAVPGHVDDWTWRDGTWKGEPMTNIDPATAREEAYTLDPAVFDRVADLVARVPQVASAVEDPELSCVSLDRDGSRDGRLTWSVSVRGPRESPTFRFALDGTALPTP